MWLFDIEVESDIILAQVLGGTVLVTEDFEIGIV
jgi:hypothetical protein